MRISEHQGKTLLNAYGINVPQGHAISKYEDAKGTFAKLGDKAVIKAMIPVGGRGKAGLVKFASSAEDAECLTRDIMGRSHGGHVVKEVIMEEAIDIAQEFYLAIIMDDTVDCPVLIFSPDGGMDIEQVAASHPERLLKFPLCVRDARVPYPMAYRMMDLGLPSNLAAEIEMVGRTLAKIYIEESLLLAEINPLVLDANGRLIAADCKLEIDDASLAARPEYKDTFEAQFNSLEKEVRKLGGTLVSLGEGDVGVICNGAGMGMAMVDMLHDVGLKPLNFLDTGGGPNKERASAICRVMLRQPGLRGLIINLWGGFTFLDQVAEGIVEVVREENPRFPVVVKMLGMNQERAMDIVEDAGMLVSRKTQTEEAVSILADAMAGRAC
ncbi:MAG: ATP-grasp domain-containing protein [Bacillota bacterium]|jgi:succinyl-CoA synthetase beta subunit